MIITSEMVISGFASKVINDCGDILKIKIKDADKNRNSNEKNMETKIYQVIVDALNGFSYNEYKKEEKVYDAAESMLKQFKDSRNDYKEAVRKGLEIVVSEVTDDICKSFLGVLCYKICKEENRDLAIEVIILQQEQTNEDIQEGFSKSYLNYEEINRKLDYLIKELANKMLHVTEQHNENFIENRAEEYAGKWDKNVFLNDFNTEDENAGSEIRLMDIYKDECMPHYIWKANSRPSDKLLKKLLKEYIIENEDKKMLLILGQPGIGKSTLITWIMTHFLDKRDSILVYQFAFDLKNVNWQSDSILNDIFKIIGLKNDELEGKILILDGFDEIHANSDREKIINQLYHELRKMNYLKRFSFIITCRENYVYKLYKVECDYIKLQAWDNTQIQYFCRTYGNVSKRDIAESMIRKILENEKIFGIPLILYMVLALNITIEKDESIADVYEQIFSLDKGSIYDRRIGDSSYDSPHRISEIKQQIYQITQRIAFWIFENNPERAYISQVEYEEICDTIINETEENGKGIGVDVFIGSYFESVKYCEGVGAEELCFVHRSIYEYFVAVYFFESICKLTSKEEIAGRLGILLKDGYLSVQILDFIKYKFNSLKRFDISKVTREVFKKMLHDGMTYHIGKPVLNVMNREMNIFSNMLQVVHLWNSFLGQQDNNILFYLHYNKRSFLMLEGIKQEEAELRGVNLSRAFLKGAHLERANLGGANLEGVDLRGAHLEGADLRGAHLEGADLRGAHLEGADLRGVNLEGAHLEGAHLEGAHLEGADLRGADLRGANLEEANLEGADLRGANLEEANSEEASFKGADLKNAHLEGAHLEGAHLEGAHLEGAHLEGAHLEGAHLEEAHLEEANLEEASLKGASLVRACLKRVHLKEANLNEADLKNANLEGADLRRASLLKADLSEANLFGANLERANLEDANLKETYIKKANLKKANLKGTNLKLWSKNL